ncbi:BmOXR1 protein, partial [Operophtera brumata]
MTYTVRDRDTLTSLAARFDTTPSELAKLNRIATQIIFPGQTLLVPDKRKDGDKESDGPSESGDNTSESTQTNSEAGTGMTPNAVMFDPNVSDTLVMEHGPESYGVIAPMEYVVNAAIFYDIAHMRTHGPDHSTHKVETAEIYYMNKAEHSPGKDSLLVKDETFPELQAAGADEEHAAGDERPGSGDEDRGGAAFPKAFERELVTPTALQTLPELQAAGADEEHAAGDERPGSGDEDRGGAAFPKAFERELVIPTALQGSEASCAGESLDVPASTSRAGSCEGGDVPDADDAPDGAHHLVKLSYHDSGIDIRDPVLHGILS